MKLAIEGLGATEGPTDGAGRYLSGLLAALGSRADLSTSAYVGPSMLGTASRTAGLDRVVALPTHSRVSRLLLQHAIVPALSKLHGADIVIYPNNYVPPLTLKPSLAIIQNMFLAFPHQSEGRAQALYRKSMQSLIPYRADSVVAVSVCMAKELERANPRLAGRIHVVYPPLDVELFRTGDRSPHHEEVAYFLAVGTVWRHRNFDLTLRALARSALPHRLVIAGATPSDETAQLQRLAQALRIDDRVQFLGVVPPDEMPYWYSGASALIATSMIESFGMSLIEAMAARTPVIAVRRTAYPETVADAGLLVDPHPEAIAAAMSEVIQPETRNRLIARGTRRASFFSYSRYADQLIDICRATIQKHISTDQRQSAA
jgi:glycosyltransferase involved in cell wall biosynthesis